MQLRDYLPKTLFGRMLSIILIPMILVQVITIFILRQKIARRLPRKSVNLSKD